VALYRRSPSVLSVQHGVDTVLLDIAHDQYFSLNQIGGRCWGLISDGCSVDDIVRALNAECDVPETPVRADVTRFVDELVACQLVLAQTE
jgi:Coenzyme PQQ synthesis protein D (PqqD)